MNKGLNLKIKLKDNVYKPLIAGLIMGIGVYFSNILFLNKFGNSISCLLSIVTGIGIYTISIFAIKVLKKDDIFMIPFGKKIYKILLKLKIYKEETD